ncbi:MAG TPA: PP2C family serine/threonine-protein phosphatase, partial [Reyranella sp.]|nr:PP2C family serine/threonine-protein phosphatase [Reyranella sp.]
AKTGIACSKCSSTEVDDQGYCVGCGLRGPRERDHVEEEKPPTIAGVSDRGIKHHRNEDDFKFAKLKGYHAIVVCDGISMSQDPDLASRAAVTTGCGVLADAIRGGAFDLEGAMQDAIRSANKAVSEIPYVKPQTDEDLPAPSCTFVGAVLEDATGHVWLGWAGDARAYFIAKGHSRQLSVDESWYQTAIANGMDPEKATKHKDAHAIERWLGDDADLSKPFSFAQVDLPASGLLALVSDGLWNYAESAEEIEALIAGAPKGASLLEIARQLVNFAIGKGGKDNITVVIAKVTL